MTADAYRWDELTRSWVVVLPSRRAAGNALRRPAGPLLPKIEGRCPFCPGNEADTEETLAAWPAEGPWRVRVVRNKYPIARDTPGSLTSGPGPDVSPGFTWEGAVGAHEVVVEAAEHDVDLPDLADDHLADVLCAYRDRMRAIAARPGVVSVAAFRNRGRRAGSSQPHPHGQVVGSPVLGPHERARDEAARAFFDDSGEILLSSLLARELAAGERVVETTPRFVALCPYAPHQSREVHLVPSDPARTFLAAGDAPLAELAALLGRTLRRLVGVTGGTDYNLVLRVPPIASAASPHAFWFIDILPRSSGGAGYEHTTGIDLVVIPPERAAAELRAASPG